MKFIVRYWSSLLPRKHGQAYGEPHWVDYSVHPASKLGLHNALLAVHDRMEILEAHGGRFGCAVFAVEGDSADCLSQQEAERLFSALPRGEVKWLDIHTCQLPFSPATSTVATPARNLPKTAADRRQLPLFPHTHTPYDDLDERPHQLDIQIG